MPLLDNMPTASPPGMAIASGGLVTALLDHLIKRKVLSAADVRGIITTAENEIGTYRTHVAFNDACVVMGALLQRFPAGQ